MHIEQEFKLDFSDVLIRPKRSTLVSRKEVSLERTFTFLHSKRTWKGVPIVVANMDTVGTFEMVSALSQYKMIVALHKFYTVDQLESFLPKINKPSSIAFTTGIRDQDYEKALILKEKKLDQYFDFICLDVPNGYLERFVKKLKELRKMFPTHTIIAGNIVTNEMAEQLIPSGADIVKVGIGSGSACLTRRQAGVGYPQLSAVIETADAAHGIYADNCGRIMSDGGAVYPSCVAKAFCGGADFLMSGSLFSGFDESAGEIREKNGKKYKSYRGMSSHGAMNTHYGKVAKHRASEGRELLVPYKGSVHDFVQELFGSLRSTGTYIGARALKEFSRRATFIRVNNQLNTSLDRYEA